jgi:hypothetical protein
MFDHSSRRRNGKGWVQLGRGVLWAVGFLQIFFIVPAFSGDITRRERSLYVWDLHVEGLHLSQIPGAVFAVALYLLYYAFVVELAYLIFSALLKPGQPVNEAEAWNHRVVVLCCSLWVLLTFLTFGDSIFQFIRSFPTFGWLVIWGCSTYVGVFLFWRSFQQKRNERERTAEEKINKRWLDMICHNSRLEQRVFRQWLDSLCHWETRDVGFPAKEPTYEELLQRLRELQTESRRGGDRPDTNSQEPGF